jgi:hypothetical protein
MNGPHGQYVYDLDRFVLLSDHTVIDTEKDAKAGISYRLVWDPYARHYIVQVKPSPSASWIFLPADHFIKFKRQSSTIWDLAEPHDRVITEDGESIRIYNASQFRQGGRLWKQLQAGTKFTALEKRQISFKRYEV